MTLPSRWIGAAVLALSSFPDFKVQIVKTFPDLKIEYVKTFPGVP